MLHDNACSVLAALRSPVCQVVKGEQLLRISIDDFCVCAWGGRHGVCGRGASSGAETGGFAEAVTRTGNATAVRRAALTGDHPPDGLHSSCQLVSARHRLWHTAAETQQNFFLPFAAG